MINSTTAKIFLIAAQEKCNRALEFMAEGVKRYASRKDANQDFVKARLDHIGYIASYVEQLEQTIKLQIREQKEAYERGYRAGLKTVSRSSDNTVYRSPQQIGEVFSALLTEIKHAREANTITHNE